MEKPKINFQDQFLNVARRERLMVDIELLSGAAIRGYIKSFDNFCLLFEDEKNPNREQLIYKHAMARIVLLEGKTVSES